jgi:AraC family transcriptional activator of pobA
MTSQDLNLGRLRAVTLHSLARGGKWRTEAMRSYDQPVLIWFTKGQGRFIAAGETKGYTNHTLVLLPPRTMHGFETSAQTLGYCLFLPDIDLGALADQPTFFKVRDMNHQKEMTGFVEQMAWELNSKPYGHERVVRALVDLTLIWLERKLQLQAPATPQTAARRVAANFTAMVERDFATGKTIADYAKEMDLTPTHLSRACKEACGRNASALLQDRIFFEARRLLLDSKLPIQKIAEVLGFSSPAYFTRAFSQRVGQSPSQFRETGN